MKHNLKHLCKISEIKIYALRTLFNTNSDIILYDFKIKCISKYDIINNSIQFDYESNIDINSNISFIFNISKEKYLGFNESGMKFIKENSISEYIKFESINNIIIKEIIN